MSDFETFAFFASIFLGIKLWASWYSDLVSVSHIRGPAQERLVLWTLPPLCLVFIGLVLGKLAAITVRQDLFYMGFYILVGAVWLRGATLVFPLLGLSVRDDVLERTNIPALWGVSGAMVGMACCFGGANIGNGPGLEAVLFSAILASGLFFALWLGMDSMTSISEGITIDRDEGAGIRLAGFLVGIGLLSGWSVAGDWTSGSATLRDFAHFSWPAILLTVVAVIVERVLRITMPYRSKTVPSMVSALYVGLALTWVVARGLR